MDSMNREPWIIDADTLSASQRSKARDSLFLMARMTLDGGKPIDVRVRNLSEGGLMADFDDPIAVGTPVVLDVRGIGEVSGQVAWFAEGRIGIALDTRIDPRKARKPVGKGGATPAYAKPFSR